MPPGASSEIPSRGAETWRDDLVAGVGASAVVLPMAMAYASIAGLPVGVGLYTAFLPMLVYALLGSSNVLSVSSTSTLAILAGAQLASVVPNGEPTRLLVAMVTLTLLVGAILLLAGLLRLGFVASFISSPVLTGFKAGVGLVIVVDQLPKLLGFAIEKRGFFLDLAALVRHLPEISLPTVAVSAATLAILLVFEHFGRRSLAPLVAVGAGIAASWWLDLPGRGVPAVGEIPSGLPHPAWPDIDLARQLWPGALGIALMSFTESIAAARAFSGPDDSPVVANRELLALGAANVAGAFSGTMPAGGGTSQTAVARAAGARSRRAAGVTAMMAVATLSFLAPVLEHLPIACLAAVVTVYAALLIQPGEFSAIHRTRNLEFVWALVAGVGVLVFGTLHGVEVAIIVSLVGLAHQTAHPPVHVVARKPGSDILRPLSPEHPHDELFGDLLIVRPEGRIYFINAQYVGERIRHLIAQYRPKVFVLDMSRVNDIEYTALQMLRTGFRHAAEHGEPAWLAGLNPGVLEVVRHSGWAEELGPERLLFDARTAIARHRAMEGDGAEAGER